MHWIAAPEAPFPRLSKQEVTTIHIGELVMKYLRELDEVAYVRFASVYREFKDVETFLREIEKLVKKP